MTATLASTTLLDASGEPVRLEDLWRQRRTAFVWLRHFG